LVDTIPLSDRGIVGSSTTLDVHALATVNETNIPVLATSRLESNLEVSLVTMGCFVPGGAWAAVFVVSPLLVNNELMVTFGDYEEMTRIVRAGFNVPFKVRLIDPRPGANFASIGSVASKEVEESAKLALNCDTNAMEVCRIVVGGVSTKSRQESPLEVGLRNGVPLSDIGIVGSQTTLDVHALTAVNETNVPPTIARRLETNLQVSLVTVGVLVPGGDRTSVVGVTTLLVNDEISVNGGGDEEYVVMTRNALEVPLEVGLINIGPS